MATKVGRPARILICDDEAAARRGIVRALGGADHEFVECGDGARCLEELARRRVDLVLLDLRMPVMDGHATLARIMELAAPPPVVVVTADTSLRSAIEAVKAGAQDYLAKPFEIDELRFVVAKTLETARLRRENRRLSEEVRRLGGSGPLLGESAAMAQVFALIDRVAPTGASVLVTGETGTGKELAARRIHELSEVALGPFVAVNCSAIPDTLVESELFGHRRGAFTGADRDRAGKFQDADGGTLFLDEIGDMSLTAQARLLRSLQEGEVEPLGGGRPVKVRVRVVAATHRDLRREAAAGRFREDLLFRLRVVDLAMPPLRERGDDVVLLARHFLGSLGRSAPGLAPETEERLRAYPWPGNVRELRNAMERAAIFCRGGVVEPGDLPADLEAPSAAAGLPDLAPRREGEDFQTAKARVLESFERRILTAALAEHRGNVSRAARALGLHRQNVQQKLRKLGISAADFRS